MSVTSTQMPRKTVVGVDPGYERLGVAVVERPERGRETLLHSECIQTSPKSEPLDRLKIIGERFNKILSEYSPSLLAIESLFFNSNQKTALRVAEARGVILYCAASYNLAALEYTPLQIKQAITGYGKSEKRQVISLLPQLITIKHPIQHDDEYDAIAIALTCTASISSALSMIENREKK